MVLLLSYYYYVCNNDYPNTESTDKQQTQSQLATLEWSDAQQRKRGRQSAIDWRLPNTKLDNTSGIGCLDSFLDSGRHPSKV